MNEQSLKHIEVLDAAIASVLKEHPNGISEYELIRKLSSKPYALLDAKTFSNNLALFKTHFVLFNALYRLQHFYQTNEIASLGIIATHIELNDWTADNVLTEADRKLFQYYSDWSNYESTSLEEVDDLIDSFWEKMGRQGQGASPHYSAEDINQAWLVLGLDKRSSDRKALKRRYHQLMHNHHPDKGGDISYTQTLSHAYQVLLSDL